MEGDKLLMTELDLSDNCGEHGWTGLFCETDNSESACSTTRILLISNYITQNKKKRHF